MNSPRLFLPALLLVGMGLSPGTQAQWGPGDDPLDWIDNNNNGIPDWLEGGWGGGDTLVWGGGPDDQNGNGIPDWVENGGGGDNPDSTIWGGGPDDQNGNGIPDWMENGGGGDNPDSTIWGGGPDDQNGNGIPDWMENDGGGGNPDSTIWGGGPDDQNGNGIPDWMENGGGGGNPDSTIWGGGPDDHNGNGIPDWMENGGGGGNPDSTIWGGGPDDNGNGIPDWMENGGGGGNPDSTIWGGGPGDDDNGNGIPDWWENNGGWDPDSSGWGGPQWPDANDNGIPDFLENVPDTVIFGGNPGCPFGDMNNYSDSLLHLLDDFDGFFGFPPLDSLFGDFPPGWDAPDSMMLNQDEPESILFRSGAESTGHSGFSAEMISAYPNPVVQNLSLALKSEGNGMLTVTMSNMQGQIVRELSTELAEGMTTLSIDVADLSVGYYVLRVSDDTSSATRLIVKE